jgi:hypothetical protein
MKHQYFTGIAALALSIVRISTAHAVAATFTQLPLDGLIVQVSNSLINTWIPFIAIVALIGTAIALISGHVHWSGKVARVVAALAILSVGLPGISTIFGGQMATSLVLP